MNDQQLWNLGAERLKKLLAEPSLDIAQPLTKLLVVYRKSKENIAAIITDVEAATVCRECAGQCCMNGKYRMNVLDLLARTAERIQTIVNFSQKPLCPFGAEKGCTMEPGLRPADCIMFICDEIDLRLSPLARSSVAVQEQHLRECIIEASRLTGEQMGMPLLLWADKAAI